MVQNIFRVELRYKSFFFKVQVIFQKTPFANSTEISIKGEWELSKTYNNTYRGIHEKGTHSYRELSQKKQVQSLPIAALCLCNIQRETWFSKILSVPVTSGIDR